LSTNFNEYVGLKPIGGATFFAGGSANNPYPLEYHQASGGGEMSRRKIGGMTLGIGGSGGVGHSTNNEFFSNNNVLLKKMVDN
jgi:hypothetical protein